MTIKTYIQFNDSLNFFVKEDKRNSVITYEFEQKRSIKDLLESIGIPHTEVDLIIVDETSVTFEHQVSDNEHINVYPVTCSQEITSSTNKLIHLQPKPHNPLRFVLDVHLGTLARDLRMLGFDCLYENDYKDKELANISNSTQRVLLTCDLKLLIRRNIEFGYYVRSRNHEEQIQEVLTRYNLFNSLLPFTRCLKCNAPLKPVNKQDIQSELNINTKKYYDNFYQCTNCLKIYWEGSHYLSMIKTVEKIRSS